MEKKYTIDSLLAGCKNKDRKTQETLYRSLAPKMLSVCMRYAATDFEAEDMMQAGFIKVFNYVADFRGDGSFEGWIRRIMVNAAIEVYRKRVRRFETITIEDAYDCSQQTFDMDSLEVHDLLKLIQQLPDGYRLVFNMYAIEGYSHKEIAGQLNITEGASKSQLSRARSWLKNKIEKMEGGKYGSYAG